MVLWGGRGSSEGPLMDWPQWVHQVSWAQARLSPDMLSETHLPYLSTHLLGWSGPKPYRSHVSPRVDKVTQVCLQKSSPPGMAARGHCKSHLPTLLCGDEWDPKTWQEAPAGVGLEPRWCRYADVPRQLSLLFQEQGDPGRKVRVLLVPQHVTSRTGLVSPVC